MDKKEIRLLGGMALGAVAVWLGLYLAENFAPNHGGLITFNSPTITNQKDVIEDEEILIPFSLINHTRQRVLMKIGKSCGCTEIRLSNGGIVDGEITLEGKSVVSFLAKVATVGQSGANAVEIVARTPTATNDTEARLRIEYLVKNKLRADVSSVVFTEANARQDQVVTLYDALPDPGTAIESVTCNVPGIAVTTENCHESFDVNGLAQTRRCRVRLRYQGNIADLTEAASGALSIARKDQVDPLNVPVTVKPPASVLSATPATLLVRPEGIAPDQPLVVQITSAEPFALPVCRFKHPGLAARVVALSDRLARIEVFHDGATAPRPVATDETLHVTIPGTKRRVVVPLVPRSS